MLPVLNIGPLAIPTGPLLLLLGAWIALSVVERTAKRVGLPVNDTYAVATTALLAGVIGARIVFVALHWSAFRANLLGIIWPLNTGYDVWGGVLIGVTAAAIVVYRRGLNRWRVLDSLAPGVLVLLAAVALAQLAAGTAYGTETSVPWGIRLFDLPIRRHPVQLYDVLAVLVALAGWWWAVRRAMSAGGPALVAAALYGTGRLLLEAYRATPWTTVDGYRVAQFMALAVVGTALFLLARRAPAGEEPHLE
jgi:phosphatidylglycerol:prolipoprotein diacylglycerol transferase